MASVRITDKLIEHVKHSLGKMFEPRLQDIKEKIKNTLDGRAIYDYLVTPQILAACAAVPDEFLFTSEEFRCCVGGDNISCAFGQRRPVHYEWLSYNKENLPDGAPGKAEVIALQARRAALYKERDDLVEAMVKILDKCVTLQQVIQVWPTVLEHVPAEVRTKHNAPNAKAKSIKPVLDELMSEGVKTAMVKATMLAKAA
jgi:hypothetical protein